MTRVSKTTRRSMAADTWLDILQPQPSLDPFIDPLTGTRELSTRDLAAAWKAVEAPAETGPTAAGGGPR